MRKLADGNCWMIDNLKFELQANKTYTGVNNATGEEISFNTGSPCSYDGNCAMNQNTVYASSTDEWYYSWYAATANSGTYSMTSGDASYSICPKGWRLPANYTINSTRSFANITSTYLGFVANTSGNYVATLEAFPVSFTRRGWFGGNTGVPNSTAAGYYKSSSPYSEEGYAYSFCYGTGMVWPQGNHGQGFGARKVEGYTVRCVAI